MAIRLRQSVEVRYGSYRDYVAVAEELQNVVRDKGLTPSTFWAPLSGRDNIFIEEIEFPDLATLEKEMGMFFSDSELMDVFRKGAQYVVQGTSRTDLYMNAPGVA